MVLEKVRLEIARAIEMKHGAEAAFRRRDTRTATGTQTKECLFWNCAAPTTQDETLCDVHYRDSQTGNVDQCPGCDRHKYRQYHRCWECQNNSPTSLTRAERPGNPPTYNWNEPEYSKAWEKGDSEAKRFFAYLLKLEGGDFYAGHTNDLRARLTEHRDGRTKTTAGRDPKLVWFVGFPSRDEATRAEVGLKERINRNPREIRKRVIGFHDLVSELDFS